jgi:hypothetical protein
MKLVENLMSDQCEKVRNADIEYRQSTVTTLRAHLSHTHPHHFRAISHSSLVMPPKKTSQTTQPPLCKPEKQLLECAARVLTAIQYRHMHPERKFLFFNDDLQMEIVR